MYSKHTQHYTVWVNTHTHTHHWRVNLCKGVVDSWGTCVTYLMFTSAVEVKERQMITSFPINLVFSCTDQFNWYVSKCSCKLEFLYLARVTCKWTSWDFPCLICHHTHSKAMCVHMPYLCGPPWCCKLVQIGAIITSQGDHLQWTQ